MPRSRIQQSQMENVLRESMQFYKTGRSVCQTRVGGENREERHRHKKFGMRTDNITCYTCGKRILNWKEHEAKHHSRLEGEIMSGIICVESTGWTDACFLMKVEDEVRVGKVKVENETGEGGRTISGGEQKVEKEGKVEELLLVKLEGRKRSGPG